jgi:hypothetical protein
MNYRCLGLAVGQQSTNGNNHMNPHAVTYYNQSGPVLLSHTEDWRWSVCLLPWPALCPCLVRLIHFAPYPQLDSTAFNDGLSVNNELQRKSLGQIWGTILQLRNTSIRIADLRNETVSEASRIHSYQLKDDVSSQNNTDHLMCYIPSTPDVFTKCWEKAGNLLDLPSPLWHQCLPWSVAITLSSQALLQNCQTNGNNYITLTRSLIIIHTQVIQIPFTNDLFTRYFEHCSPSFFKPCCSINSLFPRYWQDN